jgi:hypothetical protein
MDLNLRLISNANVAFLPENVGEGSLYAEILFSPASFRPAHE